MTDHTPLTTEQLAEIEARVNAATEGPWALSEEYSDILSPDGTHLASYWHTADGKFMAHARTDVSALLALVARLKGQRKYLLAQLAKRDAVSPRPDSALREFLGGQPAEETHVVADARANAIELAAAVIDEKLTAEPDHNRASALYELLLNLRGELPCTCARSGGLHAKGCGKYVPGHELISRHNALAAYRAERPAAASAAGESGSTR
ncbi:MAG: hypothetical protein K0R62_6264 [Nonomuraea muscovyensis]|jgi:hypothetical protein|nr:hypothetical protein [Nonomuraea muscovyensis]